MKKHSTWEKNLTMSHTHPLNYYLVYCPVAILVHWVGAKKRHQADKQALEEKTTTGKEILDLHVV
jgi:hypothetical protein